MEREQGIKLMQDLLRRMVERKGSDLFITAGFPPAIKVDGEIKPQTNQPLTPEHAQLLVRAIMNDRQTKEFDVTKECNFAIAPPGIGRFRVSAFVQMGLTGAVLRTINVKVPTIDELELPPILKEIVLSKRGLCILVGATGSSHTVCQMPVVRGYQIECGSSSQSCLPRGLARSAGSSSSTSCAAFGKSISKPEPIGLSWRASALAMRALVTGSRLIGSQGRRLATVQRIHDWITASPTSPVGRALPDGALQVGIRPEYLALAQPQQAGALPGTVVQVQDIGTYLMLTAKVGEHTLKARFSPETRLPSAGDTVWLQVLGEHTCYYQNEELLA